MVQAKLEREKRNMANKNRLGNYFEDFHVGMKLKHATPRTLTEGDRSLYIGLTGSRSALGTAQTNAALLGLERRPMEDLLVFNIAFGKTVPDISLNAVANLGYAQVRFLEHVYADDTLSVESEVIGVKENSNGKTGVVYVHCVARNQHHEDVLSWTRWVMVRKRGTAPVDAQPQVPVFDAVVAPSHLRCGTYKSPAAIRSVTGVSDLWEDYRVGERIDHLGAMTINDSDHSIATRLYQNTAKAHFDGFAMSETPAGKRLVYGGHIMSICKALSYDGLENALGILAINGGSHVSPSYAGDTISCITTVIDKFDLDAPNVGGIRLRMLAAKNLAATSIELPTIIDGKASYQPAIVLDLDYTIALPKRM